MNGKSIYINAWERPVLLHLLQDAALRIEEQQAETPPWEDKHELDYEANVVARLLDKLDAPAVPRRRYKR